MNKKQKYAIGVDLGGTSIKLGIVTSTGKILKKISIRTEAEKGPKKVIDNIIADRLEHEHSFLPRQYFLEFVPKE